MEIRKIKSLISNSRTRIIFVFILFSSVLFAQAPNKNTFGLKIDSLIIGEWTLAQIDILDDYQNTSDDICLHKISNKTPRLHKISFTKDSLINHLDAFSGKIVYNLKYSYKIEYDSIIRDNYLKLFMGKKRKLIEIESYKIIKCTDNELIFRASNLLTQGIEHNYFTTIYTYRKIDNTSTLNLLMENEWICHSDKPRSFFDENDTLTYEFYNANEIIDDDINNERIRLNFESKGYETKFSYFILHRYEGLLLNGITDIKYEEGGAENIIYFKFGESILVFNIEFISEHKLIISLNKQKSKF